LEVENLRKKNRKTLKRLQRVKRKDKHQTQRVQDDILVDSTNHTPKRKTDALILSAGLTKNQSEKVKKQLLFANIVQTELQNNRQSVKRGERGILSGLIGGKIISKYKLARSVNKSTGLGRTTLGNGSKQPEHLPGLSNRQQRKRRREIQKHQSLVIEFLTRDDNSRSNPGKQDKLKVNGTAEANKTPNGLYEKLIRKVYSRKPRN